MSNPTRTVAVIGATGYVGGRLVPALLKKGHHVRAVARSLEKLRCRSFAASPQLEIVAADALDENRLGEAMRNCRVAYYLVTHAGTTRGDVAHKNRKAARNMVRVAERAGLHRIIYLGGRSAQDSFKSSGHLGSRGDVGWILACGKVPVTWLKAAPILGSGSLYFEMLRALVERLPVLPAPRWTVTPVQAIDIGDVIACLLECLDNHATIGRTLDIGGPESVSWRDACVVYGEEAGLPRRIIIPVPATAPRLSAYGISCVTPVPMRPALSFIEGLLDDAAVDYNRARQLIGVDMTSVRHGIRRALQETRQQLTQTCWSDAGEIRPPEWLACSAARFGSANIYECSYRAILECPPEEVWRLLKAAGGRTGWYFGNSLWKARGLVDRLLGGVGLSRGRRSQEEIRTGDALDFWRVLLAEENVRLILLAEMKTPGEAALIFSLRRLQDGCELVQTARFLGRGVGGLCYWYAMAPFHAFLFQGMLKNIAYRAGCGLRAGPEKFVGPHESCRLPSNWGQPN